MKKKKSGLGSFVIGGAMMGTTASLIEGGLGTGTTMGTTILSGVSKPIAPASNLIAGTQVLKSLGKIKIPKLKKK